MERALAHSSDYITPVEVHLSDENGRKSGQHAKRCMMEARFKGHKPIGVSDEAESIGQAIDGAAEKIIKSIDHTLGRLSSR